jgi:cyclopropane fatty-acyl-phospholipid synthase-like methyltransferase
VHDQAYDWVTKFGTTEPVSLLDIGGRDVNGTARPLFPNAAPYLVVDLQPGRNVDIVADAATWEPTREFDVVLSLECFEHTYSWREITATAFKACAPGGAFIVTCAGPGRHPHSGVDGGRRMFPGEEYQNLSTDELGAVLTACGFVDVVLDSLGEDTRAWARKP